MIDRLIEKSAEKTGLSYEQVRLGLAAALFLIKKHADQEKVARLFSLVTGTEDLAIEGGSLAQNKSAGLLSGMMSHVGGAAGAAMSDAMAMAQKLTRQGIMTADMQAILPISMVFVQESVGEDLLREVLLTIPGLGSLLVAEN